MIRLFDSHCHLQDSRVLNVAPRLIKEALQAGVAHVVVNGVSEKDWHLVKEMSDTYPSVVPNFGLHPWFISFSTPDWFNTLKDFLAATPSAAVGEIGLDKGSKGKKINILESASCFAGLDPYTLYFYRCEDPSIPAMSDIYYFKIMPVSSPESYPSRIAILGDLGLTYNSTSTIEHLTSNNPDLILLVGDVWYANLYVTNGTGSDCYSCSFSDTPIPETYQPCWDYWGRAFTKIYGSISCKSTLEAFLTICAQCYCGFLLIWLSPWSC